MPGALLVRPLPARLFALFLLGSALAAPAAALDLEVIDTATGRRIEPGGVIDLASVRAGFVGQRVFQVINREPGPLAVYGCELVNERGAAFTLGRCLVPKGAGEPVLLQPGMSGRFAVQWQADRVGHFAATVRLEPGLFAFRVEARVSDVVHWHEVIDLGRVRIGRVKDRRFEYHNTRDRPLRISIAVEGPEGRVVEPPPPVLEPGERATIRLGIAAEQPGVVQRRVVVRNLDTGKLELEFSLRARVVAPPPDATGGAAP